MTKRLSKTKLMVTNIGSSSWAASEFGQATLDLSCTKCRICDSWFTENYSIEEYIYHLNDADQLTFEEIAKDPLLNSIVLWDKNSDENLDKKAGENDD